MVFRYYTPQFLSNLTGGSNPHSTVSTPRGELNTSYQQSSAIINDTPLPQQGYHYVSPQQLDPNHDGSAGITPTSQQYGVRSSSVGWRESSTPLQTSTSSSLIASVQKRMQLNKSRVAGGEENLWNGQNGQHYVASRSSNASPSPNGAATQGGPTNVINSVLRAIQRNSSENQMRMNNSYQDEAVDPRQQLGGVTYHTMAVPAPPQQAQALAHSRYQSTSSSNPSANYNLQGPPSRSSSQQPPPNQPLLLPSHQTLTNMTATPTASSPATTVHAAPTRLGNRNQQYSPLGSSDSSRSRPTPAASPMDLLPEAVSPSFFSNPQNELNSGSGAVWSSSGYGMGSSDGDQPFKPILPAAAQSILPSSSNTTTNTSQSGNPPNRQSTVGGQNYQLSQGGWTQSKSDPHQHVGSSESNTPLQNKAPGTAAPPTPASATDNHTNAAERGLQVPVQASAPSAAEMGLMKSDSGIFGNTVVVRGATSDDNTVRAMSGDFDGSEAAPGLLASRLQSSIAFERSNTSNSFKGGNNAAPLKGGQNQQPKLQNAVSSKFFGNAVSPSALLRCSSVQGLNINARNNSSNMGHGGQGTYSSTGEDDDDNAASLGREASHAPPYLPGFMRNTASEASYHTVNSPLLNTSVHPVERSSKAPSIVLGLPPRQSSMTPSTIGGFGGGAWATPLDSGTPESSKTQTNDRTSFVASINEGSRAGANSSQSPSSVVLPIRGGASMSASISQSGAGHNRSHYRAATDPVRPLAAVVPPTSEGSKYAETHQAATTNLVFSKPSPLTPPLVEVSAETQPLSCPTTHTAEPALTTNERVPTLGGETEAVPSPQMMHRTATSPLSPTAVLTSAQPSTMFNSNTTPNPAGLPFVTMSSPTSLSIGAFTPPRNLSFGSAFNSIAPHNAANTSFHLSSLGGGNASTTQNNASAGGGAVGHQLAQLQSITDTVGSPAGGRNNRQGELMSSGHDMQSSGQDMQGALGKKDTSPAEGGGGGSNTQPNISTTSNLIQQTSSSTTVGGAGSSNSYKMQLHTPSSAGFMTPLHLHTPLMASSTVPVGGGGGLASGTNTIENNISLAGSAMAGSGLLQHHTSPLTSATINPKNASSTSQASSTYFTTNAASLPPVYTTSATPATSTTPTSAESKFVFANTTTANTITHTSSGLNTYSNAATTGNTSLQPTNTNTPTLSAAGNASSPNSLSHTQPRHLFSFGRSISWSPPRGRSVMEQMGVSGVSQQRPSPPTDTNEQPLGRSILAGGGTGGVGHYGLSREHSTASTPTAVGHNRPPLGQRFAQSHHHTTQTSTGGQETTRSQSTYAIPSTYSTPLQGIGGASLTPTTTSVGSSNQHNSANSAPTASNPVGRNPLPQYPPLPPSIMGGTSSRAGGGAMGGGAAAVAAVGYGRSVNNGSYSGTSSTLFTMSVPNANSGSRNTNLTTNNNSPLGPPPAIEDDLGATVKKSALLEAVKASRFHTRSVLVDACSTAKGSNSVFGLDRDAGQQLRQSSKFARKRQIAADRAFVRSLHTSFRWCYRSCKRVGRRHLMPMGTFTTSRY